MSHWSSYGEFETNNELEPCCRKGHISSVLLQTENGGRICLSCLSCLISDSSAFLIHRTYAIDEFLMALEDNFFSRDLMTYHNQLLVTPLSEAIGSSKDAVFTKSVMDTILTMCELAENYGKNLVEDFILQTARQISAPSQWNRTEWHTLHLMGLLLELYSKQSNYLPDGISTQRGFFPSLISFLQNPGAEFQGEVLFILYKLASLEDGTNDLLRFCPKVCEEAVQALLKSDSDESRINCLALLTILAERSVLEIEFSSDHENGKRQLPLINGTRGNQPLSLAMTFIQALKGCLLSSNSQVQAFGLRLISMVCSDTTKLQHGFQIVVEEGIVDYVVEILRISEEQETVQSLALDVLNLLSCESPLFIHRFPLLLQTLIPLLEKSIDSPSVKLQKDSLELISLGIFHQPGMLLTAYSEQLLGILTTLFEQHKTMLDGCVWQGGILGIPPTLSSACSTLIALVEAPSCSLSPNAFQVLQTATKCVAEFAVADVNMNAGVSCVKTFVCLLQAAYEYTQSPLQQNEFALKTQDHLMDVCDKYLIPVFARSVEKVKDVDLVCRVFKTLALILRTSHAEKAAQFAQRLALQNSFTLSYDVLARFSNASLREEISQFISILTERLVGASFEAIIVNAFSGLPTNPTSLLLLLEQKSEGDEQLCASQHAVISILSISSLYHDGLATEIDIIASLEQHLLLNKDSTLAESVASDETLKLFLALYVRGKQILEDCNIPSSLEAERVLETVLLHSCGRTLLCSDTPKDILRWFLQKDSLRDCTTMQLLNWFTTVERMYSENKAQVMASPFRSPRGKGAYEHLNTLAELLIEEPCCTYVFLPLFHGLIDQGNSDGMVVLLRTITRLARMAPSVGRQLLSYNFEQSLLPLIHFQAINVSTKTSRFCLELLFEMLYFHNNLGISVGKSWLDVANQCACLILVRAKVALDEEVLPYLSLVNLILSKSNEEGGLVEASHVLACNRDLSTRLEDNIIIAASQAERLSQINSASAEGRILCAAMIFHLSRLRWALKNKYASCDSATSYFGFQASEWPKMNDCSKSYATSVTCKELCRILYYGPTTLKILTSFCIAEIICQLHIINGSESFHTVEILDLPSTFFMSVTMTLQGSVLEDLAVVSRNASASLFLLLRSPALSPQTRRIVGNNPWNRMLVEHFLATLSAAQSEGAICTCGRSPCYAALVALGILRITPPLEWLPIVFSPKVINNVVANLSEEKISPSIICIFQELLLLKYLANDHLIKLRNLFQVIRKKLYDAGTIVHATETSEISQSGNVSQITDSTNHLQTDDILESALLELVVQSSSKPAVSLPLELDLMNISSETSGVACVSVIDNFMKGSNVFSD